ncbi:putative transmembrane component of ABC transporter [Candidatus Vecturithrix granuli]|uniref:Putative transmembrane component of ABC transporter n=1 Tax=Vecturithrix granuli TaxID=1499967 RepID=A0A0S6W9U2_VECG1|nr:putative transmembrane component of ABC transporter [Candidatus Vecturithrix granuli]
MRKSGWKYGVLLVVTGVMLFPIFWLVSTSFKNTVDIFAIPPIFIPATPTLDHYLNLFVEAQIIKYIQNSLFVAVSTTLLALVIGTLAAYALARFKLPYKLNERLSFWVLSTRMFPPIVSIIPLFAMMKFLHLVNTKFGLVIAYAAFNLPFVVWMMRGFFQEIPHELEEAAMVDGDSRMSAFLRIVLPIARPGLVATAIFTMIMSWNEFMFALILSQTRDAATLPIGIASRVTQYEILWGPMSAGGVIAVIPVLIFAFIVQRHLVRGMSFGAIKG